jgi:stress response protein YsnF
VEVVDEALQSEEVDVERVTINRPIDEPPAVRHEGDILIIPLLEEVLFVEKRLVLREEIRIKKVQKEIRAPQQVTLRQEQVEIERKPGPSTRE